MKSASKITLLFFTLLSFHCAFAAASKQSKILIATDGGFAPFSFVNDEGKLDGFETALLSRACEIAKIECEFVHDGLKFDDLLLGLKNNSWDLTYGGIGISDDRLVDFDFVTNYIPTKYFYGNKDVSLSAFPNDLSGKDIGAEKGTKFVEYLQALSDALVKNRLEPINIIILNSVDDIESALIKGEIKLTPAGSGQIDTWKEQDQFSDFRQIGPELISNFSGGVFGSGDGFAFRKGDKFKYLIEQAMQEMLYTCEYSKIEKKYLAITNAYKPSHCE